MADFGVGKTLMMKHKALSTAKRNKGDKVIYLSLTQATRHEETQNKKCRDKVRVFKNPSVFDIANRMEFQNTDVKFYSMEDIITTESF